MVLALLCLAVSPAQDAVRMCRRPGRWVVPRQKRVRDREMRGEYGCEWIADTNGCTVAAFVCLRWQPAGRRDARHAWRDVRAVTLRRRVRQRHLRDGTDVDSGPISRSCLEMSDVSMSRSQKFLICIGVTGGLTESTACV